MKTKGSDADEKIFTLVGSVSCGELHTPNNNDDTNIVDNKDNTQNNLKNEALETSSYYSQIDIMEYIDTIPAIERENDEFIEIEINGDIKEVRVKTYAAYHLITSLEELAAVTNETLTIGNEFFNENNILFIKREYNEQWGENIGFRNFSIIDSKPTITFDRYVYDNGLSSPLSTTEQDYLLIPKNTFDDKIVVKGTITVLENEISLYNNIDIDIPENFMEINESRMWSFDSKEDLERFCHDNNLTIPDIYKPNEIYATVLVYTKRKAIGDVNYSGYYNFEFVESIPTITYSYNKQSIENLAEEYKLDVLKIPKNKINGQNINNTCVVNIKEVDVIFKSVVTAN